MKSYRLFILYYAANLALFSEFSKRFGKRFQSVVLLQRKTVINEIENV